MTETYTVGVTGAAGYIGSRVCRNLLNEGHEVVPMDDFSVGEVREIDGTTVEEGDVRDRGEICSRFKGVDALMHLAAVSGVQSCSDDEERAFDVNVGGTENVSWFCRESGTPLLFPCSMAIVGDPVEIPITADHPRKPLNFYGRTKAMSEADISSLAEGSFPAHVFMKSNLYGHHTIGNRSIGKNTVINIFIDRALNRKPLTVHAPGTQARDFIHVKDVARVYLDSLEVLMETEGTGAKTYSIASGDCRSILDIAELVQRVVSDERGYEPEIELVENPRGSEAVSNEFTVDTSKAERELGFTTEHDIERTVQALVAEE